SLDPNMQLPRYAADHPPFGTVGAILDSSSLRTYNEDIQSLRLDPIRDVFKTELGLDDGDIIEVPSLFEPIQGYAVALIPGAANLLVTNPEGGSVKLFIADPFFRSNLGDQSSDPVISDLAARLPDDIELHFVDNWDVYHMGLGEVHCG